MAEAPTYQLLPPLSAEEYQALKEDIRERGVLVAVEVDEAGNILDGHHRVKAWTELRADGVDLPDYPRVVREGWTETEKRTHVRAVNLHRRQLSATQRRELIAAQLVETPEKSNRQIAADLKVSHNTVEATRTKLEATGQIDQLERTVGADGKSRPVARSLTKCFTPDKEPEEDEEWLEVDGGVPEEEPAVPPTEEECLEALLQETAPGACALLGMENAAAALDSPEEDEPRANEPDEPPGRLSSEELARVQEGLRNRALSLPAKSKAVDMALTINKLASAPLTAREFRAYYPATLLPEVLRDVPIVRALLNEIEQEADL